MKLSVKLYSICHDLCQGVDALVFLLVCFPVCK